MYAIIETGGKQYRVQPGDQIRVEKLEAEENTELRFSPLLVSTGEQTKVGTPLVDNASVVAKVGSLTLGDKLRIYKMKRRKGYRRNTGHRQAYTWLHIIDIQA